MTIDMVLGMPAGRHLTAAPAHITAPEENLAVYGQAFATMGEGAFASWSRRRVREFVLVRAHLAPIRSRQSLAASFGRESFHRRDPETSESAVVRLTSSPVLAAYATRWLELADT